MIRWPPASQSHPVRWHHRYPARRSRLASRQLVPKPRRPDLLSRISNSALRYRDPLRHPRGLVPYRGPQLRHPDHRRRARILLHPWESRRREGADKC
jgi:hypothetical protein